MRNKNLQSGFTLIEQLIYMGLLSILLAVFLQIFTSILDVHLESQATSSITQDGNYILVRLAHDIRLAQKVTSPSQGASSNSSLQIIDGATNYTYQLTGNNLTISVNGATPDNLNSVSTKVSSINFTNLGNNASGLKNTVQIAVTLKSVTQRINGKIQTETFQTTV